MMVCMPSGHVSLLTWNPTPLLGYRLSIYGKLLAWTCLWVMISFSWYVLSAFWKSFLETISNLLIISAVDVDILDLIRWCIIIEINFNFNNYNQLRCQFQRWMIMSMACHLFRGTNSPACIKCFHGLMMAINQSNLQKNRNKKWKAVLLLMLGKIMVSVWRKSAAGVITANVNAEKACKNHNKNVNSIKMLM